MAAVPADGVLSVSLPDFTLERTAGPAGSLHHRPLPDPVRPTIWWHDVTVPALVLGSSQPDSTIDRGACARRGIEVVRRRSGGGAVLLVPGEVFWLDVIVPRHPATSSDAGFDHSGLHDVRESMFRIGAHVRDAVATAAPDLVGALAVHRGGLETTPWSSTICFDGLGPGEIVLDGAKLVGLSQRLTRQAARFQACWHLAYDAGALVELLAVGSRPDPVTLRPVATLDPAVSSAVPELLRAVLSMP